MSKNRDHLDMVSLVIVIMLIVLAVLAYYDAVQAEVGVALTALLAVFILDIRFCRSIATSAETTPVPTASQLDAAQPEDSPPSTS